MSGAMGRFGGAASGGFGAAAGASIFVSVVFVPSIAGGFTKASPPRIAPTSFSSNFFNTALGGWFGTGVIRTPSARSSSFCSIRASNPFLFSSIS